MRDFNQSNSSVGSVSDLACILQLSIVIIINSLTVLYFTDSYPVNHLRYAWKFDLGLTIEDKELSQFIVTDFKRSQKNVTYGLGKMLYIHHPS